MFVTSLKLLNFKNYKQCFVSFNHKFSLINGNNGAGKTNLIDAIHYLCLCKSYFTRFDASAINHGENFFRLDAEFKENADLRKITCKYQQNKKELFNNDVLYLKLSEHIGKIPLVMIAPNDIQIINEGSEERRRFLDTAIAQFDSEYLQKLITYGKIMVQRNALFKVYGDEKRLNQTVLDALNIQFSQAGEFLFEKRKQFINDFIPHFNCFYAAIAQHKEIPTITYQSQILNEPLIKLLQRNQHIDFESQRTSVGVHKDDLQFTLNQFLIKETGSQGQIKSFLIALKLAQYKMVVSITGKKPILLLDDIFEKLDKNRLHLLFEILKHPDFEHVIITDADTERSNQFFTLQNINFDTIIVNDGEIA